MYIHSVITIGGLALNTESFALDQLSMFNTMDKQQHIQSIGVVFEGVSSRA
jgi:hypothetical protein